MLWIGRCIAGLAGNRLRIFSCNHVNNPELVTLHLWIAIYFPLIHNPNNNKLFFLIIVLILLVLIDALKKIVLEMLCDLLEYCSPQNLCDGN